MCSGHTKMLQWKTGVAYVQCYEHDPIQIAFMVMLVLGENIYGGIKVKLKNEGYWSIN